MGIMKSTKTRAIICLNSQIEKILDIGILAARPYRKQNRPTHHRMDASIAALNVINIDL